MISVKRSLLLSVLCVSAAFGAKKEIFQTAPVGRLASAEQLSAAGIEIGWQGRLPLKETEKIASLDTFGDGVYVLTNSNYLFGISGVDGGGLFADTIAPHGVQLLPLMRRGNSILVMTGSSLRKVNMTSGAEVDTIKVPFGVVAMPAANSRFYYLASDDGKVYAYEISDRLLAFKAAADAGSLITNIAAAEDFVVFTTDKGAIVSMQIDKPIKKWRYDSSGPIRGHVAVDVNDIYVSSADTNLYKFDAMNGKILWNYMTGARLLEGPQVTSSAVYQYANSNGIYALDKKSGKVMWQEKSGRGLLTEQSGKAYLISKDQSILVMDNATGKKLFEVAMPDADVFSVNVPNGVIVVGSSTTGRVACLRVKD
jgi:hypothetical protein